MAVQWLTEAEAQAYIGRGRKTLWQWRKLGLVRAQKMSDGSWRYGRGSLRLARDESARRRAQIEGPGPGRGHKTERNPRQLGLFVVG